MESLLDLAASHPLRTLSPNETLIAQGQPGGDLFVLVSGELSVERDGISFRLAWLMANRLDATSAYLVDLTRKHTGKPEHGLLGAILSALHMPGDDKHYATVDRHDMFGDGDDASRN